MELGSGSLGWRHRGYPSGWILPNWKGFLFKTYYPVHGNGFRFWRIRKKWICWSVSITAGEIWIMMKKLPSNLAGTLPMQVVRWPNFLGSLIYWLPDIPIKRFPIGRRQNFHDFRCRWFFREPMPGVWVWWRFNWKNLEGAGRLKTWILITLRQRYHQKN